MISIGRFFIIFASILGIDSFWIFYISKKLFSLYPSPSYDFNIKPVFCAILCWSLSALYISLHDYENAGISFLEGMWLGSLVYSVFNTTTIIVYPQWVDDSESKICEKTLPWLRPVLDTLWGSLLFGTMQLLSHSLQN